MAGTPAIRVAEEEYGQYLNDLFWRAFEKSPFDVLCTVLRVGGLQDADWDPFEEVKGAFADFNWYLNAKDEKLSAKASWRIGLLMYCQAIEMTAPHEVLANLLRCLKGQLYHVKPFGHLGRKNKKDPFSWVPPSAKTKFRVLGEWANEAGEGKLTEFIKTFFRDDIRNAFSHSDYIITPERFRWTEGGFANQIPLKDVETYALNAFAFYGAFFSLHSHWRKELAKAPKYHKWPNYEVLEILSDSEHGAYGFSVHFSNGNKATYSRTDKGTDATNIQLERDGTINFFVGSLDALTKQWLVDGQPYQG